MGGAVPPLPQYAFMAWCLVRGSTGTGLFTMHNLRLIILKWLTKEDYEFCISMHEAEKIKTKI
jgi:hypothetical protein